MQALTSPEQLELDILGVVARSCSGFAEGGFAHAKLRLAFVHQPDEQHFGKDVLALHTAYADAIERVLGAPAETLRRADTSAVEFWIKAMRDDAVPSNSGEAR
jgi:hypothetical protein